MQALRTSSLQMGNKKGTAGGKGSAGKAEKTPKAVPALKTGAL
jgi:hypothetical protein